MTSIHEWFERMADGGMPHLATLGLWATVLLMLAWGAAGALRTAPAAVRYCVWQFALAGLLLLPLVIWLLPGKSLGLQWGANDENRELIAMQRSTLAPVTDSHRTAVMGGAHRRTDAELRAVVEDDSARVKPLVGRSDDAAVASGAAVPPVATQSLAQRFAEHWTTMALGLWILGLWMLGVFVHLAWLGRSSLVAQQMLRDAEPVDDARFRRSLDEIASRLAIRGPIELLRSSAIEVPVAIGILRPRILLPSTSTLWTSERIGLVLTHEAAHVGRRDLAWQLIARLAAALYWPHPLAWLAVRKMRIERERACDDLVLLAGVEPADYASGLVEVAAALAGRRPRRSSGIAMADRGQLESRVNWILDHTLVRGPGSRRARGAILLAAAGLVLTLGLLRPFAAPPQAVAKETTQIAAAATTEAPHTALSEPRLPTEPPTATTSGSIRIYVLGPDGQKVENVDVHVSIWTDEKFTNPRDYRTDADGSVEAKLPKTLRILRLWARYEGHVPLFAHWEEREMAELKTIPEEFTFELRQGSKIGGIVRDDDGQPIDGARVEVMLDSGGLGDEGDRVSDTMWLGEEDSAPITGASGRWSLNNVPPGDEVVVRLRVSHPNHISDYEWGGLQKQQKISMKSLRDGSAVLVMPRGVEVTGTITDPIGKPVKDAVVVWGVDPYFQEGSQEVFTDEHGVYRFAPLTPGPQTITVIAKGWMPDLRKIEIARDMEPVNFQLRDGELLRVKFVDPAGNPIPHVGVNTKSWRGGNSLYNNRHPNVINTHIPTKADENGMYDWTWAPADEVLYRTGVPGFADAEFTVTADGTDHVETLLPFMRVSGQVRDAATGETVDDFLVVPVIHFRPNFLYVNREESVLGRAGGYSIDFDRTDVEHGIRIEKEGYRVKLVGPWTIGEPDVTADVELQPAEPIRGRVVDGDGQPVSGAKVYLGTHTQHTDIPNHAGNAFSDDLVHTSDDDGRFSFPAQYEPYVVTVLHDSGYARALRMPVEQSGPLVLEPWARVEGQVFQSGQPVPGAQVTLSPLRPRFAPWPRIDEVFWQTTDESGRFVFERVPPGKCSVMARLSPWKEFPITSSQSVPLDVRPGERLQADLGGQGVEVTGRVDLTGRPANEIDLTYSLNYLLRKAPGLELPPELAGKDFDWRKGWSHAWTSSEEGGTYLQTLTYYFVKLKPDGSFLVSGVPAGEYELAFKLYEPPVDGCLVQPVGTEVVPFTVTDEDVASGRVELGSVEVEAFPSLQIGQPIPDVEIESADGSALKLSDLRGGHVLLYFWATWCAPCVEHLPELQRLQAKQQAGGGFTVVGYNLDADMDTARRFVKENNVPWPNAYLDDASDTSLAMQFGVGSVPAYILIGPDSKLIDRVNSFAELSERIDTVTGKRP